MSYDPYNTAVDIIVRFQSPFWKKGTELRDILEIKYIRLVGLIRYDGKTEWGKLGDS